MKRIWFCRDPLGREPELEIYLNGAALFSRVWGMEFISTGVPVPAGSFALEEVYDLLLPHLKWDNDNEEAVKVVFYPSSFSRFARQQWFYLEDKDTLRTIMHTIRDKGVPRDRDKFEEALRLYPLLLGDDPVVAEMPPPRTLVEKHADEAAYRIAMDDVLSGMSGQTATSTMTRATSATAQAAETEPPSKTEAPVPAPPTSAPLTSPDNNADVPLPTSLRGAEGDEATQPAATQPSTHNDPNTHKRWHYAVPLLALVAAALFLLRKK